MKNKNAQLVLKWAGGKRQLLPEIRKLMPKGIYIYYDSFLGGRAALFNMQPRHATVNDNYMVIRNNVGELTISEIMKSCNLYYEFHKILSKDAIKLFQDGLNGFWICKNSFN